MNNTRLAIRSLLKSPGFSVVAIIALALGIGANTAMFSIINAMFLQPLPYANASRIVQLTSSAPKGTANTFPFSWPRTLAVRDQKVVFSAVSVSTPTAFTVSGSGDAELVRGMIVSRNYFPLLGVQPVLGRGFVADEDRSGGVATVMLTDAYWQSHFARHASAIGQSIMMDGTPHTIIGVLPASASEFPLEKFQLFTSNPHEVAGLSPQQIDEGGLFYTVLARLKPGVGIGSARASMDAVTRDYARENPTFADANSRIVVNYLQDDLVGNQHQTYAMLLAAVAAVLLLACANVANLVLARFSRRRKEIAIRLALGAHRSHLLVRFLSETVALALAGGAIGVVLAYVTLRLLVHWGADFIPRAQEISLDPAVFGFTLAVSLLAGLALGLIPALHASKQTVNEALRDSSRDSTEGRSRTRFRSSLLVGEIAVSFVLLIATGLLISSFVRIRGVSPGFNADDVFAGFVVAPAPKYPPRTAGTANFYSRLYNRLREIPGAVSVALDDDPPLSGNDALAPYALIGQPVPPLSQQALAIRHLVSPDRFATLGIPVTAGRDFTEHDTADSTPVIIINETMARELLPGEDPLGHRLIAGMLQMQAEIVGVVADTHTASLVDPPRPEMFYPVLQRPENFTGILIRTTGDPAALTQSVRAALRDVDAGLPLVAPTTLRTLLDRSMADRQLTMTLLMVFAGLALLLASLGVYSVMAYSVAQRRGEIGIRMALGARPTQVQKLIIAQGMKLSLLGAALGIAGALALTQTMRAMLFEIRPADPLIYVAISALLGVVATLACWLPARRASRIDPVQALHDD